MGVCFSLLANVRPWNACFDVASGMDVKPLVKEACRCRFGLKTGLYLLPCQPAWRIGSAAASVAATAAAASAAYPHLLAPTSQMACSKIFGSAAGLVDMLVRWLPSSKAATATKVERCYTGACCAAPCCAVLCHATLRCAQVPKAACRARLVACALWPAPCDMHIVAKAHPTLRSFNHPINCRPPGQPACGAHAGVQPARPARDLRVQGGA